MRYWLTLAGLTASQAGAYFLTLFAFTPYLGITASFIGFHFFSLPMLYLTYKSHDKDLWGCAVGFFVVTWINAILIKYGPQDPSIGIILAVCAVFFYAGHKQKAVAGLMIFSLSCLALFFMGIMGFQVARNLINISWVLQCTVLLGQGLSVFLGYKRYSIPIPEGVRYWMTGIDVTGRRKRS